MSTYTIPNVIAAHPRGERIMDVYSHLLTERVVYLGTAIDACNCWSTRPRRLNSAGVGYAVSGSSLSEPGRPTRCTVDLMESLGAGIRHAGVGVFRCARAGEPATSIPSAAAETTIGVRREVFMNPCHEPVFTVR